MTNRLDFDPDAPTTTKPGNRKAAGPFRSAAPVALLNAIVLPLGDMGVLEPLLAAYIAGLGSTALIFASNVVRNLAAMNPGGGAARFGKAVGLVPLMLACFVFVGCARGGLAGGTSLSAFDAGGYSDATATEMGGLMLYAEGGGTLTIPNPDPALEPLSFTVAPEGLLEVCYGPCLRGTSADQDAVGDAIGKLVDGVVKLSGAGLPVSASPSTSPPAPGPAPETIADR